MVNDPGHRSSVTATAFVRETRGELEEVSASRPCGFENALSHLARVFKTSFSFTVHRAQLGLMNGPRKFAATWRNIRLLLSNRNTWCARQEGCNPRSVVLGGFNVCVTRYITLRHVLMLLFLFLRGKICHISATCGEVDCI